MHICTCSTRVEDSLMYIVMSLKSTLLPGDYYYTVQMGITCSYHSCMNYG